jgi:sulfur carrier protein
MPTGANVTPPVSTPPSAMLTVRVNGQPQTVASGTTLADWLQAQQQPAQGVATAVNGVFVARERRAQQVLQAGDSITTFQPIVGG